MSIRVMTLVWDSAPVEGTELLCLLAMADYAHDDGSSIFPSVPTLARRIRLSPRQTQRVLKGLAEQGLIEKTGQMPDARYIYRLTLGGDIAMSPVSRMSPVSQLGRQGGDTHDTRGGDIATTPKPLVTPVKKPSSLRTKKSVYPMTEDWIPDEAAYVWCEQRGISRERVNRELDRFRLHWLDKDERRGDWNLTLRKWVTSPYQQASARPGNGHAPEVDRRPAIKPAEFGPAKRMSDEKKAALREQFRREFEA